MWKAIETTPLAATFRRYWYRSVDQHWTKSWLYDSHLIRQSIIYWNGMFSSLRNAAANRVSDAAKGLPLLFSFLIQDDIFLYNDLSDADLWHHPRRCCSSPAIDLQSRLPPPIDFQSRLPPPINFEKGLHRLPTATSPLPTITPNSDLVSSVRLVFSIYFSFSIAD